MDAVVKKEFDISKVIVTDLDGQPYKMNIGKPLGNLCFMMFNTIEWDAIARAIHKGQVIEITDSELDELLGLIRSPQVTIVSAVRAAINIYINTLKEKENAKILEESVEDNCK